MGMASVGVNYVAVIVAAVVSMVIGFFWYSESLFGKHWMKYMKFTKKDVNKAKEKGMGKTMLTMFITTLIMAYILAHFIKILGIDTMSGGVQVAFWIWLGFLATTQLGAVLWENKPLGLYYINTGHSLVSMVIMGAILAVM
jgi:sterol desaturase/sphingolipid hydroxylase (fatty acid hydroxylase superfamily)